MCLILVIISLASIGGSTSCFDEVIYRCWHTLSLVLLSHHKTHPVMLTRIIRPPLLFLLRVCMLPCVVCKCLQVSFRDFVTLQGSEEELRFQRLRTLHVSGVASLTAWCRMQIAPPPTHSCFLLETFHLLCASASPTCYHHLDSRSPLAAWAWQADSRCCSCCVLGSATYSMLGRENQGPPPSLVPLSPFWYHWGHLINSCQPSWHMTTITLLTIAQLRTLNTHSAAAPSPRGPVCSFYYRCLAFRVG